MVDIGVRKSRLFGLFLVIGLFLIVPVAFGDEEGVQKENLYTGWVELGETIVEGPYTFIVDNKGFTHKVTLDFDGERMTVKNDSCGVRNRVEVCLLDVKGSVSEQNIEYRISIDAYIASITFVKREIDETNLSIGDKANIQITFTNEGDREATNVYFVENTTGFTIGRVNGCLFDERKKKVYWQGTLNMGGTHHCSYRLEAAEVGTYISQPIVSFFNGNKQTSSKPSKKTFTISGKSVILRLEHESELEYGVLTPVTIVVNNSNPEEVDDVAFEIEIDDELGLGRINPPLTLNMGVGGGTLAWRAFFDDIVQKTYPITFQPTRSGEFTVPISISFREEQRDRSYTTEAVLYVEGPEPTVQFSGWKAEIMQGEEDEGTVLITNPTTTGMSALTYVVSSPLFSEEVTGTVEELGVGERSEAISVPFTVDGEVAAGTYDVEVEVEYTTSYGETLSVIESKEVTVLANEEEGSEGAGEEESGESLEEESEEGEEGSDEGESEGEEVAQEEANEEEEVIVHTPPKKKERNPFIGIGLVVLLVLALLLFIMKRGKKKKEGSMHISEEAEKVLQEAPEFQHGEGSESVESGTESVGVKEVGEGLEEGSEEVKGEGVSGGEDKDKIGLP